MLVTIHLRENLTWHHLPESFVLVVDDGITLLDVIDLIGVKKEESTEIMVNGKKVSWGVSVSEGDEIEILSNKNLGE